MQIKKTLNVESYISRAQKGELRSDICLKSIYAQDYLENSEQQGGVNKKGSRFTCPPKPCLPACFAGALARRAGRL